MHAVTVTPTIQLAIGLRLQILCFSCSGVELQDTKIGKRSLGEIKGSSMEYFQECLPENGVSFGRHTLYSAVEE